MEHLLGRVALKVIYLHVLDAPLKYLKHTKWDFYNHSISHWKTTSETCIACGIVASEKCEQKCLDMEMVNLCKTPAGTPAGENYTQGYLHGLNAPLSFMCEILSFMRRVKF